ncbi:MAG: hypothetical protein BGO45_03730 [Microbacterium sp. 71-36]|uniref:hypothetical protein n=1 Tax=unclassified Microbacterium TaxID=2609290 RepID=UPI00086B4215|nr:MULTISPECIES: hypothetical protein [unclassified Microbacterium]MBN9212169.1 hypothetical protein [Microbacterium sp.]ODT43122.1 MAG: hypothetical protein ABS60_00495 [Microbacterium sp. SCN 71-17]OJV74966.1 MAG: hypothetical protein BGO45_03730 [Microbacterium sp. 71-36]
MKPLSRTLGVVSLLLAIAAVTVPALGALLLLRNDSSGLIERAAVVGLAVAGAGVLVGVVGYVTGRRVGATALPIIGGVGSLLVAVGFAVAPLFV